MYMPKAIKNYHFRGSNNTLIDHVHVVISLRLSEEEKKI